MVRLSSRSPLQCHSPPARLRQLWCLSYSGLLADCDAIVVMMAVMMIMVAAVVG